MKNFSNYYNLYYNLKQIFFHKIALVFDFLFIRIYFIAIIFLNIILWFIVFYLRSSVSQDLVILHYNVDFGVDLIGSINQLLVIPILAMSVIIINVALVFFLTKHRHFIFLSHLLLASAVLVNVFLIISLAPIYLINFR